MKDYYMKEKIRRIIIISVLLVNMMFAGAFAASDNVVVSLPEFKVFLNDVQVDNSYRQYPLIVYKDITYFPMTYYDCRLLGLETKWDSETGLEISKTGITGGYRDYTGEVKNKNTYMADVSEFNIKVNGNNINNSEEEYPLLTFRGVTYFPLTWRFAVEEFGWKYDFDPEKGLIIQSSNPKLAGIELPEYSGDAVVAAGQYYYYGGTEGGIYQASITNPKEAEKIFQLPLWSYGDSYVYYELAKEGEEVWLKYHQGGAVMGRDYFIRLNEDGTCDEVDNGYLTFKTFGDITVKVDQWSPPVRNNLLIKYPGQEYERVGASEYLYGWNYELREDGSQGGSASKDIYLKDDTIYILAVDKSKEVDESRIYKVNIQTDETSRISDIRVNFFKMYGENIYFLSEGKLYKMPVDGGNEIQLETTGMINDIFDFIIFESTVYYVGEDNGLYRTGTEQSLNPGGKVTGLKQEEGYVICTFEEDNITPYRIMIFDKNGQVVKKSSDVTQTNAISIEEGRLFYAESKSKQIFSTEIN